MHKLLYTLIILFLTIIPINSFAQESDDFMNDDTEVMEIDGESISSENNKFEENQYTEPDAFYRAEVQAVESSEGELLGRKLITQKLTLKILDKDKKGEIIVVENGGGTDLQESQIYKKGDVLVVVKTKVADKEQYYIQDRYRLPGLLGMVIFFLILTIIFAGKQGIGSMLGLIASVGVLVGYLVPSLLGGQNPVLVTFIASFTIITLTIFVSHGFRVRTFIAFASMNITLILAYIISAIFVYLAHMFGVGSEDTFYLASITNVDLDLRGILLAGVIVGMLGVLDDVTVAQAATIDEIKRANPSTKFKQLYQAGMSVGRDHIASLVNTLALAYVGSSLPLFLLLYINSANVPIWVTLNSEFIGQELVRTLSGSIAIILAVPITSLIA
ncbi:YibE/F family protein, partial [bacterium]|nr:YibE/F family protein [Candidatus Elulimicrobium humile]